MNISSEESLSQNFENKIFMNKKNPKTICLEKKCEVSYSNYSIFDNNYFKRKHQKIGLILIII